MTEWVRLKAKYVTTCRRCYKKINKGQQIEWNKERHTSRHIDCTKGNWAIIQEKKHRR